MQHVEYNICQERRTHYLTDETAAAVCTAQGLFLGSLELSLFYFAEASA